MQMNKANSLSIIVSAVNEEKNISSVIEGLISIFEPSDIQYEILVFDDGSTDNTYQVALSYVSKSKNVRVFKNEINRGIGYCFKEGIRHSRYNYITFFPGDNQNYADDLYRLSQYISKIEVIIGIPYYKPGDRSLFRWMLSKIVTKIFTSFVPMRLPYVTNMVIYSKDLVCSFEIKSNGFMFQIEILLKGLRSAKTYIISNERIRIKPRIYGQTKAIRLRTLFELVSLFFILVVEFYLTKRKQFHSLAERI